MTAPQPTPQWTALNFIVVAVLLLVILGVLASGIVKSCSPPPVGHETRNMTHNAACGALVGDNRVVGPLMPGGRWARLREKVRTRTC